jgi:hypothetical protein
MSDKLQTFTTDSAPGEQDFERIARDATSHLAGVLQSDSEYYGPKMNAMLRIGVRTALRAEGEVTRKRVERAISSEEFAEKYDAADRDRVLEALDSSIRGAEP